MASTDPNKCANCGAQSTMSCVECMAAPEYKPGDAVNAKYCSHECRSQHSPEHKDHCRILLERRKLQHIAKMLKLAILTYRDELYDLDLTKIEFQQGVLHLFQRQKNLRSQATRVKFPGLLTSNARFREAALLHNQCTMALALLGPFTRILLSVLASKVEVLVVRIRKPTFITRLTPGPDTRGCPHNVIKVTTKSAGEEWIIDTTGAQYGFQDILVPYEKYIRDADCQIMCAPTPYVVSEVDDLDHYLTCSSLGMIHAIRSDIELEKRARRHFAAFLDGLATGNGFLGTCFRDLSHSQDVPEMAMRAHLGIFKIQITRGATWGGMQWGR